MARPHACPYIGVLADVKATVWHLPFKSKGSLHLRLVDSYNFMDDRDSFLYGE